MKPYITQRTLASSVACQGVGLHSGQSISMILKPADPGTGIYFLRTDCRPEHSVISARWSSVVKTELCTVLGNTHGVCIATVEHLMAALAGTGVTNAIVEVDGPEIPACDGSAAPFIELIEHAGIEEQAGFIPAIQILKPLTVRRDDSWMTLEPGEGFSMAFDFDFGLRSVMLPMQSIYFEGDYRSIMDQVSHARTVGFLEDYAMLKEKGFARGGSLENAVVYHADAVINPEGLRYSDECVRHKVLDAIGDLSLLNAPLLGTLRGHCSGHSLNAQLMSQLMNTPHAWRWASLPSESYLHIQTAPWVFQHSLNQHSVFCL